MKIKVSHILVKHQYEAEDILKALNAGKTFEELAQRYSLCPSSAGGGDLGFIASERLDADFEEAAVMLKVGQITTRPVRTKFGYHLIKRTG